MKLLPDGECTTAVLSPSCPFSASKIGSRGSVDAILIIASLFCRVSRGAARRGINSERERLVKRIVDEEILGANITGVTWINMNLESQARATCASTRLRSPAIVVGVQWEICGAVSGTGLELGGSRDKCRMDWVGLKSPYFCNRARDILNGSIVVSLYSSPLKSPCMNPK